MFSISLGVYFYLGRLCGGSLAHGLRPLPGRCIRTIFWTKLTLVISPVESIKQFNLYIQRLIQTVVNPGHTCRDTHIRDFRAVTALVAAVPMAKCLFPAIQSCPSSFLISCLFPATQSYLISSSSFPIFGLFPAKQSCPSSLLVSCLFLAYFLLYRAAFILSSSFHISYLFPACFFYTELPSYYPLLFYFLLISCLCPAYLLLYRKLPSLFIGFCHKEETKLDFIGFWVTVFFSFWVPHIAASPMPLCLTQLANGRAANNTWGHKAAAMEELIHE